MLLGHTGLHILIIIALKKVSREISKELQQSKSSKQSVGQSNQQQFADFIYVYLAIACVTCAFFPLAYSIKYQTRNNQRAVAQHRSLSTEAHDVSSDTHFAHHSPIFDLVSSAHLGSSSASPFAKL
ncbi:hypothetical protein M5D96_013127 [Drosophila gunungcola]|uniref:Uncharacterized protein n=1 Tax=Drosophila gunungcola TaxID=103775 RepID=A0A9P9YC33_9MUSC|nr:hypothetical protein M5D96_013127 [Drosophila gunungcola]